MHLTVFSDYTLRVLMYLALERTRLTTIPEIAAAYGISENPFLGPTPRPLRAQVADADAHSTLRPYRRSFAAAIREFDEYLRCDHRLAHALNPNRE
jgi:hypothetical protein